MSEIKTISILKKAEPLVVLHGWGMNSSVWQRVRPALEASFNVIWLDLPGHGENTLIKASSLEQIVEFILPKIPDGAHLMGWSLGGLLAQAIAQQAPFRIKTLTLVASTPRFSQAENWHHAMSQSVLNTFAKNLQNDPEATLKRFIALQFMGIKNAKKIQQKLINDVLLRQSWSQGQKTQIRDRIILEKQNEKSLMQKTQIRDRIILKKQNEKSLKKGGDGYKYYLDALKLGLDILTHADFRQDKISIPQHWIFAKKDRLVPAEVINDLKLMRTDAQITLLENAGHAPFMTHPDEFTASVLSFLKSYTEYAKYAG